MPPKDPHEIEALYRGHPLNATSILERAVACATACDRRLRESDLALDPQFALTDQNHIGGLESTMLLAQLVEVSSQDRVLDLGCGLGGSCRVLAAEFGCSTHGIDLNANRIADARRLTDETGLRGLATFSVADATLATTFERFSLVWCQNSAIHMGAPTDVCRVLAEYLSRGARAAFEEVCTLRATSGISEDRLLQELGQLWGGYIYPLEQWRLDLNRIPGAASLIEVDTQLTVRYLTSMAEISHASSRWPADERRGLGVGRELAASGLLGYFRATVRYELSSAPRRQK